MTFLAPWEIIRAHLLSEPTAASPHMSGRCDTFQEALDPASWKPQVG